MSLMSFYQIIKLPLPNILRYIYSAGGYFRKLKNNYYIKRKTILKMEENVILICQVKGHSVANEDSAERKWKCFAYFS